MGPIRRLTDKCRESGPTLMTPPTPWPTLLSSSFALFGDVFWTIRGDIRSGLMERVFMETR
jgi:hypothetical protein